jgi:hypothetical protein
MAMAGFGALDVPRGTSLAILGLAMNGRMFHVEQSFKISPLFQAQIPPELLKFSTEDAFRRGLRQSQFKCCEVIAFQGVAP